SPARSRAPRASWRRSWRWPGSGRSATGGPRAGCERPRTGGMLARPVRGEEVSMATGSSGGTLLAALALGAAIVVASLIVKSGLDDQTVALADLEATVAELGEALAAGAPSAARREPRRGRDPNQRVEIPLGDS